jgi:hypothetical protein
MYAVRSASRCLKSENCQVIRGIYGFAATNFHFEFCRNHIMSPGVRLIACGLVYLQSATTGTMT